MFTFFAPGRVNLIGEHIDYNGGLVFPAAINLGIHAQVTLRSDDITTIESEQMKGTLRINIHNENYQKRPQHWMNYPLGVLQLLKNQGIILQGLNIKVHSTLPIGTGLSSSAALEVLIAYIFLKLAQHPLADNKVTIAQWCKQVENNFIGVQCGIMDQFAVAMGKSHHAICLNCDTLAYTYVPLNLQQYNLLILNTNKSRTLAESAYNKRKKSCEKALAILQTQHPIQHLCAAKLAHLDALTSYPNLLKRARHCITENSRVQQSIKVLETGNINAFGQLMYQSHYSLQHDYAVTGFELDTVVQLAMNHAACIGARMTGAGFGGCAIALVHQSHVQDFTTYISQQYQQKCQLPLDIYNTKIANGVAQVS